MPSKRWNKLPRVVLGSQGPSRSTETQCDACPPSAPLAPSAVSSLAGAYSLPSALATIRLDDHHWIAYAPGMPAGPAVLNDQALGLLRRFERPHTLQAPLADGVSEQDRLCVQTALLALQRANLVVPAARPMPCLDAPPQTLIAWLHVTGACNLHCAYCFLDASPEAMTPEVGSRAIDAVFRSAVRHQMSGVKLKYAGGEPTLAFSTVARLHRRAIGLAERYALDLDGVVISNGVGVTAGMLETMRALGLRLAISLDGLGSYHDCQRPLSGGAGSFAAVSQAVERALSSGMIPDISVTITGRNLAGLPELTEWLLDRDLPFGFEFYRENDAAASQENLRLDEEATIETMRRVFRVVEHKLLRRSLLAALLDRTNLALPHARSCGVGVNYLVIDPRGRIAKCQMDIGHTITDVSAVDPLADIRAASRGIQNLPVDEKEDCQRCTWRYWCGGGCPIEAYRVEGRWSGKSPYCAIYRTLIPEVLRLEGLRLLRSVEPA